jgi:RNA polymerase II transcription elongation factor
LVLIIMDAAILPQPGADYPLVLGQTLRNQPADLCYMRYDFKPASVARQGEGNMSIDGSEVSMHMHAHGSHQDHGASQSDSNVLQ